jgi:hypothetical protein
MTGIWRWFADIYPHGGDTKRVVYQNWLRLTMGPHFAECYEADDDDVRGDVPTWMTRRDQED